MESTPRMRVYCLYFSNGKRYIGIESRKGSRINYHAKGHGLKTKSGHIQVVTRAIQKYGWENVRWRYLITNATPTDGAKLEIAFIKLFRTQDPNWGYNISPGGDLGLLGVKMSAETRAKHSCNQKGRACPEERKARISAALMGHQQSPETKAKIKATKIARGLIMSDEERGKIPPPVGNGRFTAGKEAPNKGRVRCVYPDGKIRMHTPEQATALGFPLPNKSPGPGRSARYMNSPESIAKRTATRRARYGT